MKPSEIIFDRAKQYWQGMSWWDKAFSNTHHITTIMILHYLDEHAETKQPSQ